MENGEATNPKTPEVAVEVEANQLVAPAKVADPPANAADVPEAKPAAPTLWAPEISYVAPWFFRQIENVLEFYLKEEVSDIS